MALLPIIVAPDPRLKIKTKPVAEVDDELRGFIERHRARLEDLSKQDLPAGQWMQGFNLALRDFCINRVPLYLMGHTFRNYKFLERVVRSVRRLSRHLSSEARGRDAAYDAE